MSCLICDTHGATCNICKIHALEIELVKATTVISEQKETVIAELRKDQEFLDSLINKKRLENGKQAELIEKLAEALKYEFPPLEDDQYWENIMGEWCLMRNGECLYEVTGDPRDPSHIREALAAYEAWKK